MANLEMAFAALVGFLDKTEEIARQRKVLRPGGDTLELDFGGLRNRYRQDAAECDGSNGGKCKIFSYWNSLLRMDLSSV